MRDKRFIDEHRGGPLSRERHRQLAAWAHACAAHVLPLSGDERNGRLNRALAAAAAWMGGTASVGAARSASLDAIAAAREAADPASVAVARAVGHAAAVAHMADHALAAALYALAAVKSAGRSVDAERKWQNDQLPPEIRELVLSARVEKEKNRHL